MISSSNIYYVGNMCQLINYKLQYGGAGIGLRFFFRQNSKMKKLEIAKRVPSVKKNSSGRAAIQEKIPLQIPSPTKVT